MSEENAANDGQDMTDAMKEVASAAMNFAEATV